MLLVLLCFGGWRALNEGQQSALLSHIVSLYEDRIAAKYDVAIDDLDLKRAAADGRAAVGDSGTIGIDHVVVRLRARGTREQSESDDQQRPVVHALL